MRIVTPDALRELSGMVRRQYPDEDHALHRLTQIFDQCAVEIESRDAQIEGLKLALREQAKAS